MSKTCGECSWFSEGGNRCKLFINQYTFGDRPACNNFKPKPTIGDKIRQMSNTDLAEMLVYPVKPMNVNGNIYYEFTSSLLLGKSYPMREQAVFLTERRLNAPADCVAENGKSAKQADLCCKSAKESEGEDE